MAKPLGKTLREALIQPASLGIALSVTALMLVTTVTLMNNSFLQAVLASGSFSPSQKLRIVWVTLGSFRTTLSGVEQAMTLLTAVLSGINIAVLTYYIKQRVAMQAALGASTLGIVGSLLGVGCASCGSVLLVSLFGFSAAAGFLAALPLGGMEFGLGSIAILTLSIAFMLKKLRSPLVCK